jgi:hypothetical protein
LKTKNTIKTKLFSEIEYPKSLAQLEDLKPVLDLKSKEVEKIMVNLDRESKEVESIKAIVDTEA